MHFQFLSPRGYKSFHSSCFLVGQTVEIAQQCAEFRLWMDTAPERGKHRNTNQRLVAELRQSISRATWVLDVPIETSAYTFLTPFWFSFVIQCSLQLFSFIFRWERGPEGWAMQGCKSKVSFCSKAHAWVEQHSRHLHLLLLICSHKN